jgi:D-aspartate ligase
MVTTLLKCELRLNDDHGENITMTPAIVLSGHTAALGIVRSLGRLGVPVVLVHYGDHDFAGLSRYVSLNLHAPHPEYSEDEFIIFLLDLGNRFPAAVLFPATDECLVAVSRHIMKLEKHFRIACNCWDITRRIIDKQFTYTLAQNCGIPIPQTIVPKTIDEARAGGNTIGFPCLVKPCQGHLYTEHFGRKMIQVNTLGQLEDAFTQSIQLGLEVMLQEYIPGEDSDVVNYNSYVVDGKVLVEFTAVHVRNGPPWSGSPRVVVSRNIPGVIESGQHILRELGYNGFSCIEFKFDVRDGQFKLLDINGRHNLSTLLAVRCGINFPWMQYKHIGEGILPQSTEYQKEVYWIDVIRDFGYTWKYLLLERHSFMDYIRPYFQPHIFAIFDRHDIRPFLRRIMTYKGKK